MSKELKVPHKSARKHRRESIKSFRTHRKLTKQYERMADHIPTWKSVLENMHV